MILRNKKGQSIKTIMSLIVGVFIIYMFIKAVLDSGVLTFTVFGALGGFISFLFIVMIIIAFWRLLRLL